MPGTGKYTTFDPIPTKDPAVGKGKSDLNALRSIYSTSPLKNDGSNRTQANTLGTSFLSSATVDDGGYMYGVVQRDFSAAPDYKDVAVGGEGLPSPAWTPNINSPGEGNGDDPKKVAAMDASTLPKPNTSYDPSGQGVASPIVSSKQIGSVKLGDALTPGKHPNSP